MSLSQTEKEHLSRFLKILTDGAVRQLILEESSRLQSLSAATEKRRAAMSTNWPKIFFVNIKRISRDLTTERQDWWSGHVIRSLQRRSWWQNKDAANTVEERRKQHGAVTDGWWATVDVGICRRWRNAKQYEQRRSVDNINIGYPVWNWVAHSLSVW